jgi:hypothetical protein
MFSIPSHRFDFGLRIRIADFSRDPSQPTPGSLHAFFGARHSLSIFAKEQLENGVVQTLTHRSPAELSMASNDEKSVYRKNERTRRSRHGRRTEAHVKGASWAAQAATADTVTKYVLSVHSLTLCACVRLADDKSNRMSIFKYAICRGGEFLQPASFKFED